MKHIVFVTPGFAASEADTTCIPTLQCYFLKLKSQYPQLKITIVTLEYPHVQTPYLWHGIDVIPCYINRKGVFKSLVKWGKAIRVIRGLHKVDPISLLHSFWLSETSLIAFYYNIMFQLRVIVTLMGQDALKQNKYKTLSRYLKNVVAISKNQASHYHQVNKTAVMDIIPWGIDINLVQKEVERGIDVLGVGNLIPLKNYSFFIDIIEELKESFPELKAVIIGKGEQEAQLKKKVLGRTLEGTIELRGEKDRSEVLATMQKCKVFLHTSNYEGQGYVFYEALEAGAYVVSGDVGCAQKSSQWSVCATKTEMIKAIKEVLTSKEVGKVKVPKIEETVEQYMRHYKRILSDE